MRRGWSDLDAWNLDRYLAHLISDSVTHLRDHGHAYPSEEHGANEQQCHDILTRIAAPLSLGWDRIVDDETSERRWERQERELSLFTPRGGRRGVNFGGCGP